MPSARSRSAKAVEVRHVRVGDRDADHLHRRQPGRERAGVVLGEHAEEPLDRAEQRPVDHDRPLPGPVRGLVFQLEPLRQLEVHLDGRHLPGPADRVPGLHGDLRPVERGAARVGHQLQPGLLGRRRAAPRSPPPSSSVADELLRVAGGQLQVEVVQPVVAQQVEHEAEQRVQLAGHLLLGAVDVRVVLGQATHPGEPVHDAGLLVPVDGAELEQPQRQLPVGPAARPEDQVVERAVHRLEVVVRALQLHGREHAVRVPVAGARRSRTGGPW